MASTTSRFGLYKKDPVADANTNFDVKTMINDNLDTIDAKAALKTEIPSDTKIQGMIDTHANKKDNPHGVTTAQVNQITAKNGDALADTYPNGISQFFVSNTQTGWPGTYGTVTTYRGYASGTGGTLQVYVPYSDQYGGTSIKYRYFKYQGTAWTAWFDYETTAGAQAKVDTHAGDTTKHITAAERTTWNGKASTAVATTSANGLMSSTDKSKLDGIAVGANNYTHPATHPPSIIAQDASNRFVTDGEKTAWNGKETTSGAQTKADTAQTNAQNYAFALNSINSKDTRDTASLPSDYTDSTNGRRLHVEFKRITTVGLPVSAGGTYATVVTDARWIGSSGGRKNQMAFTDSGKVFTRLGSADETAWGEWVELETTAGAQAKVDNHAGDTVKHITAAERAGWNDHAVDTIKHITAAERTAWNGKASTAVATSSANGLMASGDKSKLDGLMQSISAALPATAGWYRVAQTPVDVARSAGRFEIDWTASGSHGQVILNAGIMYGNAASAVLNQTQYSTYNTANGLTQARIVYHTTYAGTRAYLEVYNATALAITVNIQLFSALGWSLLAPNTAGSIPSGYSNNTVSFVAGITTEGQFKSTVATGTAPLVVASTTAVSNLNADMIDGAHAGTGANNVLKLDASGKASPSIIAQDASNRFMTDAERTKLNGIETGAQVNDVTSVAGKTGAVTLAGTDVPAATTAARGTVQLSTATNSTSTTLAATASAVKAAYDLAAAATTPAEALLAAEHASHKTTKSGKDANGVFTTVEYRRKSDDTLLIKSVLSGGTSPQYTTRTVTYYAANGTTVSKTETYTLTYDADDDLVSEV
ncbi:tail fiber protein [Domibacillus sp.]|uniref:tail fiber protein n=1 Tax=Domibacillus sp. TaxID=1969783 RepID=UPI00281264A7|nr:tail fiber protein [Domibacillus sp.]